jgi:hypothetical protein
MEQYPSIVEIQNRWAGLWVAVKSGEVVEPRPTPDALVLALRDRDIVRATIFRCPADDEAELVGLG